MSVITIPVEKAQKEFSKLLKDVEQGAHHYILTDKEQPIGTLMSASEYEKLMRYKDTIRLREQYLRMLIEEGIEISELKKLIKKMDKIDQAFESGDYYELLEEADEYAEKKIKEWCAKHGLEYKKADDKEAQELINAAIRRVRAK